MPTKNTTVVAARLDNRTVNLIRTIAKARSQTQNAAIVDLLTFALLPAIAERMAADPEIPIEKKLEAVEGAKYRYSQFAASVLPNVEVLGRQIHNLHRLTNVLVEDVKKAAQEEVTAER